MTDADKWADRITGTVILLALFTIFSGSVILAITIKDRQNTPEPDHCTQMAGNYNGHDAYRCAIQTATDNTLECYLVGKALWCLEPTKDDK